MYKMNLKNSNEHVSLIILQSDVEIKLLSNMCWAIGCNLANFCVVKKAT